MRKEIWLLAVLLLAIVALAAYQPNDGIQQGSQANSDAGDLTLLNDGSGTEGTDDHPYVKDRSCGNGKAYITITRGGRVTNAIIDPDGCQGGGKGIETEVNFSGHTGCKTYFNGFRGCGVYSVHESTRDKPKLSEGLEGDFPEPDGTVSYE